MTDLQSLLFSFFTSGAISIGSVYILGGKILDNRLKKDIQKFQMKLEISKNLQIQKSVVSFEKEIEVLAEGWDILLNLYNTCSKLLRSDTALVSSQRNEISSILIELETFLERSEPFIDAGVLKCYCDIIKVFDNDAFSNNHFLDLKKKKKYLAESYRQITYIK